MDTRDLSVDKKEETAGLPAGAPARRSDVAPAPGNASSTLENMALDIAPVGDALAEPESSIENSGNKRRAFISTGERFDHWSKYLTVDWVWNATSSACFAYWGKFTESGKKLWNEPVNKIFNFALKPMIKNPENLKAGVRWGNTFSSIIMGGLIFTIPPLLVLESKKVKLGLIKFYDRLFYGKDKVENDPKFQQAYSEIQEAPKKGFWANFISRYIALAPLLASVIYKPSREWLGANVFSHVATGTKATLSKVGLTPERLFKKFSPVEREVRWKYINEEALSMDLAFGLPYAVMHSFFYNMLANTFAGRKSKSKDDVAANPQVESSDKKIASPVITATVAPQISPEPAPSVQGSKKWADTAQHSEKPTPAARLSDNVPNNFVDKLADKNNGELQIV